MDDIKGAAMCVIKYGLSTIAAIAGLILALLIAGSVDNFSSLPVLWQALAVARFLCATSFLFLWLLLVTIKIEALFKKKKGVEL